jgi:hypothetical protein
LICFIHHHLMKTWYHNTSRQKGSQFHMRSMYLIFGIVSRVMANSSSLYCVCTDWGRGGGAIELSTEV